MLTSVARLLVLYKMFSITSKESSISLFDKPSDFEVRITRSFATDSFCVESFTGNLVKLYD